MIVYVVVAEPHHDVSISNHGIILGVTESKEEAIELVQKSKNATPRNYKIDSYNLWECETGADARLIERY